MAYLKYSGLVLFVKSKPIKMNKGFTRNLYSRHEVYKLISENISNPNLHLPT